MYRSASAVCAAAVILFAPPCDAKPFVADRDFFFESCKTLHRYESEPYATTARRVGTRRLDERMKAGVSSLLDSWQRVGDANRERLAYVLATARRESRDSFQPLREAPRCGDSEVCREKAIGRHLQYTAAKRGRSPKQNYALPDKDGLRFYGRGFVQLTHRSNYQYAARQTGHPLVSEPDKALEPAVAAEILIRGMLEGWYGKHRKPLSAYLNEQQLDWINARNTVNPESPHKAITAEYAKDFLRCLRPKA
jgi:putative chitinase